MKVKGFHSLGQRSQGKSGDLLEGQVKSGKSEIFTSKSG